MRYKLTLILLFVCLVASTWAKNDKADDELQPANETNQDSGLYPTARETPANEANRQAKKQNRREVEENTARFVALVDYDVKGEATVRFRAGSTKISPEGKEQLIKLAKTASGFRSYLIEVTGYADATGRAVMNTTLSEDRAQAVISYLMQRGNISVRHIVAPAAMGDYGQRIPNEAKEVRPENRRVDVKVLVYRSVATLLRGDVPSPE
jgi:outer membrane protein OmpA-like peptidoglycan-associated protein